MKVGKKRVDTLPSNEEEGLPSCVRTKESGKEEELFQRA
jgi:hypothetical protein